jgi:hypothetical protein
MKPVLVVGEGGRVETAATVVAVSYFCCKVKCQ